MIVTWDATSFEKLGESGKFLLGEPAYKGQQFEVSVRWTAGSWATTRLVVNQ